MNLRPPAPEFPFGMDPIVHLEALTKDFRSLRALDGVSLDIGPGVTGLLGPNGAGKTTLIKVLLGLLRATEGSGRVLGFKLGAQARAIRGVVGYMPEDDCYIDGLTGVGTVSFSARVSGIPPVEAVRRAHEILDFCGIEQERYRQAETYSTGMRQKLKFAQAIVHDPPLLILDEPTAGLDPEERQTMLNRIRTLARDAGKAILISTHILPDVQTTCETVIILARGRVRLTDRMDVLSRPSSPRCHIRCVGASAPLAERLGREGYTVTLDADATLTVEDADAAFTERVWTWANETGVAIQRLAPARNSLEDVFLAAVRGGDDADS